MSRSGPATRRAVLIAVIATLVLVAAACIEPPPPPTTTTSTTSSTTTTTVVPPAPVGPGAVEVSAGGQHSCAVFTDGTIRCWGQNQHGQLGDASTQPSFTPVPVAGIDDAVSVSAGARHSCALHADGTVSCWGANDNGQSGLGSSVVDARKVLVPRTVTGVTGAVAVSAGGGDLIALPGGSLRDNSCAVLVDGTVSCWGTSFSGFGSSPTPFALSGLTDAVDVAAGAGHACVLVGDGSVWCAGNNGVGQLGDGTTTNSSAPVQVTGLADAVAVAAGRFSSCAVTADGSVSCWGSTFGIGSSSVPVAVSGVTGAVDVSVGGLHSCATIGDGTARCWGSNVHGELGDGTTENSSEPVSVAGFGDAVEVSVGGGLAGLVPFGHTCALVTGGSLRCWGADSGQLGRGAVDAASGLALPGGSTGPFVTFSVSPVDVVGLRGPVALDAGRDGHTCAVMADRTVRCWGANGFGQLGDGTTVDSSSAVTVNGVSEAVEVAAGGTHTCARTTDGRVLCWGFNGNGELGTGSGGGTSSGAVQVVGLTDAVRLAAGRNHTCALLADGSVRCWGSNGTGQLGDGSATGSATPVPVVGLPTDPPGPGNGITGIAAGDSHTCARYDDRASADPDPSAVFCWGRNNFGQLGNGTTSTSSLVPTQVVGLSGSGLLVAGGNHTCLGASFSLSCWGHNASGQLGNSSVANSPLPVSVVGVTPVSFISGAGTNHSCHRTTDATSFPPEAGSTVRLACVGDNASGQLGDGTNISATTAVFVEGLGAVAAVSGALHHTCALAIGASPVLEPRCWGANSSGQLGDGTTSPSQVPVFVPGLN